MVVKLEDAPLEIERNLSYLAAIIESTSDAVFSKSQDGIIQSWNPGAENLFGYSPEEIIGKHFSVLVPDGFKEPMLEIFNKVKQGISFTDVETVRLKKDGTPINVSLTISPIKDHQQNLIGISVIMHDIEQRIQMRNELLGSEQKYRQIVEEALEVVYTCDYKGNFTYFNPAFKKETGYDSKTFLGRNFIELVAPEWKEKVREFYQIQFKEQIPETIFSFPYLNSKGEQRWVEQTVIIQKEGTWVKGFQSIVRDISERKTQVEELRQSEHKIQRFLDYLPIGITIFNKDGKLEYSNKKAA